MRLLIINPNTSEFVTNNVVKEARRIALPETDIIPVTGKRGVSIISGRAENALGTVESINLAAEYVNGCDAILLAVSFDSGLKPLRELFGIPVVGMTESAMLTACMLGGRFSLVTFGNRAVNLYRELAVEYGLAERMADVCSLRPLNIKELENPMLVISELVEIINTTIKEQSAEAIILAGAVFAGLSEEVSKHVSIPVVDGISSGVCMAEQLHRLNFKKPTSGSYQYPNSKPLKGMSSDLTDMYNNYA